MAVRRVVKKARAAKKIVVKAPTKRIKKDIKSLKRGLKKEIAVSKKASKSVSGKLSKQAVDLVLLKKELDFLKKKRKKAGLSSYNRFMRAQIKKGISFKAAAKLWQKQKKADAKKNRKRSGYNVFVSMQLKQGKNMKQAIRAWNLLKNPVKKKRAKRNVVKKPVKRIIKKKIVRMAKPVVRNQKRSVVRKIVRVGGISKADVAMIVSDAISRLSLDSEKRASSLKELFSEKSVSAVFGNEECDEALALKMLDVYFREVARRGLKRSLSLDEVIDSYIYTLTRIKRKGVELEEICNIVNKNRF